MISTITLTPSGGSPFTIHAVTAGSKRVVTRAEGLQGVAPIREVRSNRGQQHGGYLRSKFTEPRLITLEGEIIGSNIEDSFDEFDTITKALYASINTAGTLKWTRSTAGQALQCDCQLASFQPLVLTDGGNMLQYQISLVAGDPRVYDQTETTTDSATVTNAATGATVATTNNGSVPSPPVLRVYGGIQAPVVRLVSGGAGLTFTNTVASGDYMEIDVKNRTAKTNGTTNVISGLNAGVSEWFDLPVGSDSVKITGSALTGGSPKLTVIYRSAWA
jgi:hypothetical protein